MARSQLADAAWATHRQGDRGSFFEAFAESLPVDDFMEQWWPQLDPREVLLWLADTDVAYRLGRGSLTDDDCAAIADPFGHLEGTGKGRRHVKLTSLADVKGKKLSQYLPLAVAAAGGG